MSVSTWRRTHRGASRVSVTVAAILASTAGALGAPAASAHGRLFHFDITPEPLSQALRTYAQVCGQDVIFTESVVAGTGTTSLVGDFTADDALSRLLAGTKLVVQRSPSGALMIRRRGQASTAGTMAGQSTLQVAEADPPAAADPSADPPAPQAAAPTASTTIAAMPSLTSNTTSAARSPERTARSSRIRRSSTAAWRAGRKASSKPVRSAARSRSRRSMPFSPGIRARARSWAPATAATRAISASTATAACSRPRIRAAACRTTAGL